MKHTFRRRAFFFSLASCQRKFVPIDLPFGLAKKSVSAPIYYRNQAVILSNHKHIASIVFEKSSKNGVEYQYRLLDLSNGSTATGKGELFENYERIKNAKTGRIQVKDLGSQLKINLGSLNVTWSLGGKNMGWLYYKPQALDLEVTNSKKVNEHDLLLFQPNPH